MVTLCKFGNKQSRITGPIIHVTASVSALCSISISNLVFGPTSMISRIVCSSPHEPKGDLVISHLYNNLLLLPNLKSITRSVIIWNSRLGIVDQNDILHPFFLSFFHTSNSVSVGNFTSHRRADSVPFRHLPCE